MSNRDELTDQIKGIVSINYACKAASIPEKILWVTMFVIGILYAIYFIIVLIIDGNTPIISKINVKLSDLYYPAMTICPQGTTKYAIAERLGNYLDGNSDFLEKFPSLKEIEPCILPLTNTNCQSHYSGYPGYVRECIKPRRHHKPVPPGCKVRKFDF